MPEPNDWRVRIRMYRQWLGDCFLLTFRKNADRSHILVDCGIFSGTPQGPAQIRGAVAHIQAETNGRLNALVVTHEHWDHLSGFWDAKELFHQFHIDEVWAAWT